jgi:3-methyl-2-oxobutanoate hydroxymethyltransferase
MGGYKVQGRQRDDSSETPRAGTRERIIADALAVEEAGASAVVLEGIPSELAKLITEKLSIPTIGIGAGPSCDGQILVTPDLLGMTLHRTPKFVKRYADIGTTIREAVAQYLDEVRTSVFPSSEFSYQSPKEGYAHLS